MFEVKQLQGGETPLLDQNLAANSLLLKILANLQELFWVMSIEPNQIIYISPASEKIWGADCVKFKENPQSFFDSIHPDDSDRFLTTLTQQRQGKLTHFDMNYRIIRSDGQIRWLSSRIFPLEPTSNSQNYLAAITEDLTHKKEIEEQLIYTTRHDPLTGLYHRVVFINLLNEALKSVTDNPEQLFGVIFININRFKVINNSLGYRLADELLKQFSKRLQMYVGIFGKIARFGGNEFAILVEPRKSFQEIEDLAASIEEGLSQVFNIDHNEIFVSCSIGIVLSHRQSTQRPYESIDSLLRDAEVTMDRAKQLGHESYEVFHSTIRPALTNELQLEIQLRKAVNNNHLRLYYQPIISLDSGELYGFEALIRWEDPDIGLISPALFIPIAEETGLILSLGEWVIKEAARQILEWQQLGMISSSVTVSVNVAGKQFAQFDLVDKIDRILMDIGLPSSNFKLEITESIIMDNIDSVTDKLQQLKALGFQLSIDDFGTGYSSLSRLHTFPIDTLKIDRSFVNRLSGDSGQAVVKAIISLGSTLGLKIIAEGIETSEQLEQLQQLGCHYGQGYLFSKPLKSADMVQFLEIFNTPPDIPDNFTI